MPRKTKAPPNEVVGKKVGHGDQVRSSPHGIHRFQAKGGKGRQGPEIPGNKKEANSRVHDAEAAVGQSKRETDEKAAREVDDEGSPREFGSKKLRGQQ